jgi:hypothetical protein
MKTQMKYEFDESPLQKNVYFPQVSRFKNLKVPM